ncbi:MAG: asparagine synthase (glutamine-hydrolyzing), partial [Anaerolineae bacterium]|nr:asparagine synthase (glutamine-hydrolyzing) [Anaerolineae bacterium]
MCGIAGYWNFNGSVSAETVTAMTTAIAHRGPDSWDMWVDAAHGVGLGHRRLAIIDLSEQGRQPMSNDSGEIRITYNGEVYNYAEIKADLVTAGFQFRGGSDTEVIVKAYEAWGIDECLRRLRGMYAFALWDRRQHALYLVRDRLGVKPLYFAHTRQHLLFGSELKALIAHPLQQRQLNHQALWLYLQLGYVPSPLSIYEGIHKLEPAHYLRIDVDGAVQQQRYWNLADYYHTPINNAPETEIKADLTALFTESFAYRLIADVPVGVFLSGGIDSTLVAALLTHEKGERLRTFTVAFDDPAYDESYWAGAIAEHLGTDHTTLTCTEPQALGVVERLPQIYDEPFSDKSGIPTSLLCEAVSGAVKVALSGDGGDEFFCGYNTFAKLPPLWSKVQRVPYALRHVAGGTLRRLPASTAARVSRRAFGRTFPQFRTDDFYDKVLRAPAIMDAHDVMEAHWHIMSRWPVQELSQLAPAFVLENPYANFTQNGLDATSQMMLMSALTFLPGDYLVKVDRASMAVGLEVRDPMLDHKLIEYACALPLHMKYRDGVTKYIVREILYDYVPRE